MIRLIKLSVTLTLFLSSLLLLGFGKGISPARAVEESPPAEVSVPLAVCTPDTADMVAYWPLDDGSGATTFDDLISADPGNQGTCTGGSACPASTAGKIGTAFDFDGLNDEITIVDAPVFDFDSADSFSFEMWINTTQVCTGNKVFLGKANTNGSSWWVGCTLVDVPDPDPDINVAAFFLEDEAHNDYTIQGDDVVNDNAWHHVVAIRDDVADENRLYVDGALDASLVPISSYTGTFTDVDPVDIGHFGSGFNYDGVLDEVAIYNRALTGEEILAHYNGGTGQSLCNAAPVAVDDELTTDEDTPVDFTGAELLSDDSDPDGTDPTIQTVAAASTEGGTVTDNLDGTYTYAPPDDFNGTDAFTYTIVDGALVTDEGTVTVTVDPVTDPPVVTDPGDQTNEEGDSPSLQIIATDADGDILSYSATGLPPDLDIDPNSGVISGEISQAAAGSYDVTVTVTDGTTPVDVDFTWTVNAVNVPPDVTQPEDQSDVEGDTVNLLILATDEDGDTLTYDDNDSLPPGLSINSSTGAIGGTVSVGAAGVYSVTVTVTDGTDPVDVEFSWTITSEPVGQEFSVFLPLVINQGGGD